ncbi:FecR family protein [Niabella sp. W65]|nr:FecR family protein [Niabella sp. W65]MCH7364091.1 FecR family protein [Niabella sp. W65]
MEPGNNKATLTLSDGSSYQLDEDSAAIKSDSSGIYYKDGKAIVDNLSSPVMATIRTPNGGQYHLTLPDGTQVTLNAASSLVTPPALPETHGRWRLQVRDILK